MSGMAAGQDEPVERLVTELFETGILGEGDKADLRGYLSDWKEGRLHPDDLAYLKALHARLLDPERPALIEEDSSAVPLALPNWRERAETAEAEVERLRALLQQHGIAEGEPGT